MGGCSLQHSFPPLLPSNAIARGSSSPPPSARLRPVSTPAYALQVTTHAIFPTSQPHFPPLHLVLAASYTHAFVLTFVCPSCLASVSRVSQVLFVVDLSDWLLEERLLPAQVTSRCNSCVIAKPPFGQVGYSGPPFLCLSVFSGFWVSDVVRMG